ncbi:MAG: carboxypeptidase-like regulatory domain-containing protein [Leeuwenhoekiella sp.]
MKIFYLFVLLFSFANLSAQSFGNRMIIEGKVNVPPGDDSEGIVIFNESSNSGTITNSNGIFFLNVRKGDKILVQSVQFSTFELTVDLGMIQNKKIIVTLRESLNKLDEIVITPTDLTGNIAVDVNRVIVSTDTPNVQIPAVGLRRSYIDDASPVPNDALDRDDWKYGLDFVNIFKALFDKRDSEAHLFQDTAEDELSQMYSNAFFKKNLNIDEKNIGGFVDYVAVNGLKKDMLTKGNELNLIQFLLQKRDDFVEQKTQN